MNFILKCYFIILLTFLYMQHGYGNTLGSHDVAEIRADTDCKFRDIFYPLDTVDFLGGCFQFKCVAGNKWKVTGVFNTKECECCTCHNDPHCRSFAGVKFEYHKLCRHSMTQKLLATYPETSAIPGTAPYFVVSRFGTCMKTKKKSCLKKTVVKVKDTKYELTHAATVGITKLSSGTLTVLNGDINNLNTDTATHISDPSDLLQDILMFNKMIQTFLCIAIYFGNIYVLICPNSLTICVKKSTPFAFAGLCGTPDEDKTNDFMMPNNTKLIYSTPGNNNIFGLSWKIGDETMCNSTLNTTRNEVPMERKDLNEKTCMNYNRYLRKCSEMVNPNSKNLDLNVKQFITDGCVVDLCAMKQDARTTEDERIGEEIWLNSAYENTVVYDNHALQEKRGRGLQ